MTNPMSVPLDEVRALIEERERYEGWLDALEARRANTPAHVFERVRGDYDSRLRDVGGRLAQGLVPLREAEAGLARRQDEVVRTLTERQDELAELELRTLVGEFHKDEGERRIQEAATVVRELDGQRRSVSEELDGVRALLTRAETRGSGAGATPAPASQASAASATDQTQTSAGSQTPVTSSPATPADGSTGAAIPNATPAGGQTATPSQAQHAAPMTTPQGTPAVQPWARRGTGDGEAFVGTGERLDSLAAALGGTVTQSPSAAPVAGHEKTLRCQDCGEMNYPTEWYCERCGGELAAL